MEMKTSGMIRWHWLQLRAAIKLERVGMKHSSGKGAKAAAIKELQIKRNSNYDAVIEAINKKLGELK